VTTSPGPSVRPPAPQAQAEEGRIWGSQPGRHAGTDP